MKTSNWSIWIPSIKLKKENFKKLKLETNHGSNCLIIALIVIQYEIDISDYKINFDYWHFYTIKIFSLTV